MAGEAQAPTGGGGTTAAPLALGGAREAPRTVAPAAACAGEVLRLLARSANPLTLAEIERSLPRTKSLIYRVLVEFEQQELVRRDGAGRYGLGLEAFELGPAYLRGMPFEDVVKQELQHLSDMTLEPVNLGYLRGTDILYVMKFVQPDAYVTISRVGGRVPAHCVAIGKSLLARLSTEEVVRRYEKEVPFRTMTPQSIDNMSDLLEELERVRQTGYGVDRAEAAPNRRGLAIAVELTAGMGPVAAISISMSAEELPKRQDELISRLRQIRDRIQREVRARDALVAVGTAHT